MDRITFKKEVLKQAKLRQEEIIKDFKVQISELNDGIMNINEGQLDSNQQSINNSESELLENLGKQLDFVENELDTLNKIEIKDQEDITIAIGSIVVTDKMTFFPSTSVEKFEAGGQELFGISEKAPLFIEMRGKSKGDEVSYKETTYLIEDVY